MLKFKDFKKSFFSLAEMDDLLPTINTWIFENKVTIINIETLYSLGGTISRSEIGFRVWYNHN